MAGRNPGETDESELVRYQSLLKRLDRYANLMDSRFQVPGTRMRFGLDGLIGLIPGIGDLLSLGLSLYILAEALRVGAPASVVRRISTNIGLDFLVGLVPIAGDAIDFAFKANKRNAALLRNHAQAKLEPTSEPPRRPGLLVWGLAAMGVVLVIVLAAAL